MDGVSSATQASSVYTPEEVMSKDQYYVQWMKQLHPKWSDSDIGHYNDANYKFAKFFGDPSRNRFESEYEAYLNNINNRNEQKAVQSARAYEEFMSNTAYSRAFDDLSRAGINPYMLLNNGSAPSTSVGSSSKPNYSAKSTKDTEKDTKSRDFALVLLALMRLAAAL